MRYRSQTHGSPSKLCPKATKVKAVFSETSLTCPGRPRRSPARPGVKVVEDQDALYGDSLGPAGSDGDTYLPQEGSLAFSR